ncbi:stereocilin [Polypterus senegalus]|uniref:stereocilin n=1 Tax=Polypterus senegalus TaxID=55291 RepID=UPI00196618AD|nr:stereocilin [Polypterus senegalus]
MEASDPGVDLQSLCSDAAWYLSAAEADFLWVTVCSEYFATEFNSTVCSNSSFWVARAQSQVTMQKEFYSFNQTSIDNLCQQMSSGPNGSSLKSTSENCLSHLNTRVLNVQNFSRCFLPNASTLIGNLCGTETTFVPVEGSWAFEFCTKNWYNFTSLGLGTCDIRYWTPASFENATLLKHCWNNKGFRNYICHNDTIYYHLAPIHPWILGYCADPETNSGDERCFLQKIFDLLPIPYDFESSQLCQNPTPHLLEILYKLSECKGEVHELHNWIVNVNYILRLLDFIVSLPSGFDTGKREVRAQLSEAILLSSLLDNTSFYAALSSNASLSVLQAVGDFLRNERNVSLKEDLLSCFSPVLWDLIQKEDNSSSLRFLFQEYLQMPRESLRSLLMSAENEAVKRFLSHMHQTWNQLQVSQQDEQAMEMMTSALLHKFPRVTPDLFVDLSQFIPFMSVSDIMSFPSLLLVNDSVLTAIRDHSSEMKPLQKRAFVKRLLQSNVLGQVPLWPPYFLRSLQPLLPHLPLCHFQQLTAEQLIPLVETLGNSSLDTTRGRHVLRTIFGNKQNITAEIAQRLGILLCYMNPENLQALLRFQPFVKRLLWCVSEGLISPTSRRAHSLLQAVKSVNASELTSSQLASLRGILPQLGISFLNHVSMTRITDILAKPGLTDFSPAQAFLILKKIMQSKDISIPHPCQLWPLRFGLGPAFMKILQPPWTSDSSCQCWKSLLPELGLAQRAMLLETLQILRNGSEKLSPHIDCLLPFVPLKELTDDGAEIFKNIAIYKFQPWSTHQAQYLFKKILQTSNITKEVFMSLGSIARGVTCNWVRNWANHSDFGELLIFITQIPLGIHPSLKKCVIEEIQKRSEMDLQLLPPQFSIDLPLRMIETLPNSSLEAILDHISRHFSDFLRLPHYKQSVLVERASSILGVVPDQEISGMLLDLLGPLFPFLDSSRVEQVQREALLLRLDEFKGYCLPPEALLELGQLLKEAAVLGEPSGWTQMQMEHAGRLVLSLSPQEIYQLPKEASSLDIVEQILESQRDWETSKVGQNCGAIEKITEKKKSLTARFVTGTAGKGKREPIPSCSDLKGTFPAAWTTGQFLGMLEQELLDCLDMLGQDPDLSAEQRKALWDRLKQFQMYVPLRSVKPEQILQLGWIVTQLSDKELQELNLSHLEIVAYMGQFDQWTPKQMRAIVLNYLKRSGQSIEDLEMSKLVSYGFLICGLSPTEISRLDPKALSKSALFLGELNLGCSELQAEALTTRIMLSDAFGPVSEWGPEIFTEIGTLAAGLPDVVLSSLIREQFEGLTPAAIGLMPASKFAVVFSPVHLSWMTPEQARAVTPHQWAELNSEQSQAVTMAQYEGELIQEQRDLICYTFFFNHRPCLTPVFYSSHSFCKLISSTSLRSQNGGPLL